MEMKDMENSQREEAGRRLDVLTERFNLSPRIREHFNEGRVYYSYITAFAIGSIDTIEYDPRYAQVVREFEGRTDCLVYHAIETGNMLALLYVSSYLDDWPAERLQDGDYISAYVHNFASPQCSEFGDIFISGYGEKGCLVRNY